MADTGMESTRSNEPNHPLSIGNDRVSVEGNGRREAADCFVQVHNREQRSS